MGSGLRRQLLAQELLCAGGKRRRRLQPGGPGPAALRGHAIFTAQLEVAVVHRDVAGDVHVAPGPLWVFVGVSALVAEQGDFGDEVLVLAEGRGFGRRPVQAGVASRGDVQVPGVVDAVVGHARGPRGLYLSRGQGCRKEDFPWRQTEVVITDVWVGVEVGGGG